MNILIAGATSDIGIELIKLLIDSDNKLYLLGGRNKEVLFKFRDKVSYIAYADLSKEEEVDKAMKDIRDIDIFINLIGKSYFGLFQFMDTTKWMDILNINLNSSYFILKKILPDMINKKFGKIILTSSIWGKFGASLEVAYSTSKGALDTLVKSLGKEMAPSNISLNSINFGLIDTKMNYNLSDEDIAQIEEDIPYGRMATPLEAATFIKKIMEMPQYFTAQNISFDGGWF